LNREKLTAADVITGELGQSGDWVVACVEPQVQWPTSVQKITYRGQTVFVLPQFDDYYPSLVVKLGAGLATFEAGQVLILNLLSAMCWVEGRGALVDQWVGGNLPRPMAGFSQSGIHLMMTDHFRCHYLPDVIDQQTRWALAFYREGLSIHQVSYAFLSFYKIINILHDGGAKQKAWINANVNAATANDHVGSNQRLQELRAAGTDVGEYLYESGRCAVAHAGQGPTVDPENPADLKRLMQDLPLVRALAAYAIEFEFKIKSAGTVYKEHLYELEGFRALFGEALCQKLKDGEEVNPEEVPTLPALHVGLHGKDDYGPLTDLRPAVSSIESGMVYLGCTSADGRTRLMLGLDFPNERLRTNIFDGLISLDDGSEVGLRNAVAVMTFKRAYFANGELVVKRVDTGALMGRCDAFLPTNVDMGGTLKNFDAIIAELTRLANERSTHS